MITLVLTPRLKDRVQGTDTSAVFFFPIGKEIMSLSMDLTSHGSASHDEYAIFEVSHVRMDPVTSDHEVKHPRKEELK